MTVSSDTEPQDATIDTEPVADAIEKAGVVVTELAEPSFEEIEAWLEDNTWI